MKKITLLFTLIFTSTLMFGQIVLSEDFEAGATIPAGWTNNDIAAAGDTWVIATGGEAALAAAGNTLIYSNGGAVGNYASFDSDGTSDNSAAEEVALESPIFSCASLTQVTLQYNHLFAGNFGGSAFVEVSTNGTTWTTVDTYSADGYTGGTIGTDVTAELAGAANAQVRFRWTGDFSVAWYVDNISVFQCSVAAPSCVTEISPMNNEASATIVGGGVTFAWNEDPNAESYELFINEFSQGPRSSGVTFTGFDYGTAYTWSVVPTNCAGDATGCATWSFTTEACTETAAPAVAASTPVPTNAATAVSIQSPEGSLALNWAAAANPGESFTVNIGTENPPATALTNFENGGTVTNLAVSTTYFWSVDVVNCFGTTTGPVWSFTTDATLSIDDNVFEAFSAYPNPTSDVLNIKTTEDIDNVTVFNLLGQSVASFTKNEITNSSIDLSELSKGLYLVKVSSGNNTQTLRVTKE